MNVLKGTDGVVLSADGNAVVNGDGIVALPDGVGYVDLGTLDWVAYGNNRFYSLDAISNAEIVSTTTSCPNCLCVPYTNNTPLGLYQHSIDKSIGFGITGLIGEKRVVVVDSTYSSVTAEEFKSAMNGVLLFYKKSTT